MLNFGKLFRKDKKGKTQGVEELIMVLAKAPDSAKTTQLVKTLIDYFYDKNLMKVKLLCFVPYVIYFASAIFFFSYPMINEEFQ